MRGLHFLAMTAALLSAGTAHTEPLAPDRPADRPRPFRRDQSLPMMGAGWRRWGRTVSPKHPHTKADHAQLAKAEAKRARRRERNRRNR